MTHDERLEDEVSDPEQSADHGELGTQEYSESTPEYLRTDAPDEEDASVTPEDRSADAWDGSTGEGGEREPFWKGLGFSSFESYLAYMENADDRAMGRPERNFEGLSAMEIVLSKPTKPPQRRASRMRDHQVSVKLTAAEHDRLREAARMYSVPRSTMARMLVVRGASLILEAD
jgi:hypothetical protein